MPYIILISFILCTAYMLQSNYVRLGDRFKYLYPFIIFPALIYIILFFGLRFNVGRDYMTYYNNAAFHLYDKEQTGTGEIFEPFFQYLYDLVDFLYLKPYWIFVFTGIIINGFFFYTIYKFSRNYFLSFFVYFGNGIFFNTLNGMRQFIAVMILFFAYKYIVSKHFWKWTIAIIIAGMFHKSAFFMFPFYYLGILNNSKKVINIILVIAIVLRQFDMSQVLRVGFSFLPAPYNSYGVVFDVMKNQGSGLISYILWWVALLLNNSDINFMSRFEKLCFKAFVVAVFFLNVFYQYFVVTRIMEYFLISVSIVYPCFYSISKKRTFLYFVAISITLLLGLNIIKIIYYSPPSALLFYRTIFD